MADLGIFGPLRDVKSASITFPELLYMDSICVRVCDARLQLIDFVRLGSSCGFIVACYWVTCAHAVVMTYLDHTVSVSASRFGLVRLRIDPEL